MAGFNGGKGAISLATARRLAALGPRIVSLNRSDSATVQTLLGTLPVVKAGPHFAITAEKLTAHLCRQPLLP